MRSIFTDVWRALAKTFKNYIDSENLRWSSGC